MSSYVNLGKTITDSTNLLKPKRVNRLLHGADISQIVICFADAIRQAVQFMLEMLTAKLGWELNMEAASPPVNSKENHDFDVIQLVSRLVHS